jgi:predicted alpha-1,2-mannosidase
VAWLEELTWADAAMARLAEDLGAHADAAFFGERAHSFRNVWDEETGFFRGRLADGSFEAGFDPLTWQEAYVEGNAWQYLWMPFPEWEALAETLGGREAALARLGTFFEEAEREGVLDFPQTYYWHGNEPDIHTPWLFALWGDKDAAWRWVRWVADTHYAAGPVGLAGNDDGGTLSAWYVFAGLGLYPIAGTDQYVVTPPLFPAADVPVEGGRFTVRREGEGARVKAITLNGEARATPILRHGELRAGGELVVSLGE